MSTLYMMMGLPGSGKSTIAEAIRISDLENNAKVFSSDALRKEIYGDESIQRNNQKIFQILFKRIKEHLASGCDAIYDATNIQKKHRIEFLNYINTIPGIIKVCICVMTPYETCLDRNESRERVVPEEVIKNMYCKWSPPHYSEGFDVINIAINGNVEDYTINNFLSKAKNFDQNNKHHSLSLGDHCKKAADIIEKKYSNTHELYYAALLHDNGKIFTKTDLNIKGINDGQSHFYNHNNCGAYDSIFFMANAYELNKFSKESNTEEKLINIIQISNIIYYHMHPYLGWEQSEKALNRDKTLLGEDLFNMIIEIHNADAEAH